MKAGKVEHLEIQGHRFYVQTEVVGTDHAKVRTTVFAEGRVIGQRELVVGDLSAVELAEQIRVQHTKIVQALKERMGELSTQRQKPAQQALATAAAPAEAARRAEPPDPGRDPRLLASVRVRQFLGRFCNCISAAFPQSDEELATRMHQLDGVMAEILQAEQFLSIRVDEQVRFNILKGMVNAWLQGEREQARGLELYAEIVTFASYLGNISNRQDLVAFDRELLLWAVETIGGEGVSHAVKTAVHALYGRDAELDTLLQQPESHGDERWLEVLMDLLERVLAGAV